MTALRVLVYRHSAFYSPLLGGIAGGFFAAEGFQPTYTVLPAGRSVAELLAGGSIDVAQAAVSGSWSWLDHGRQPPFVHFAQINQRDGFLIASRRVQASFAWPQLLSGSFMFAHGGQPQAMLAYALHRHGVDLWQATAMDGGDSQSAMAAFGAGTGDWFHEQAPYPQQLEQEGKARIVASVGEVIGPVAFSSLAALPAWLARPEATRFMRAYRKAREWVNTAPPDEVATAEQIFFPKIDPRALAHSIQYYQQLGCWSGDVTIERGPYEKALDVFAHSHLISRRHAYDSVVVSPPA